MTYGWNYLRLLIVDWYPQDFLFHISTTYTTEDYSPKSINFDTDTLNYLEAFSGEKYEEYYKAMDVGIDIFILINNWEVAARSSKNGKEVFP